MLARVARRPSTQERIAALRAAADAPGAEGALREALRDRSNHVVASAARLAAERHGSALVPDLEQSFARLLPLGSAGDKTCAAKNAIAHALLDLDAPADDVFLAGSRHFQHEPALGGSVDAAAELRAACAIGLSRRVPAGAVLELVRLLADPEPVVRRAAARALGGCGRVEAEPLLRLKVAVGDAEPDVLGECFAALLASEPQRSLAFVAEFLVHADLELAAAAALALGASRLPGALEPLSLPLAEGCAAGFDPERRRVLCTAIATLRRDDAFELLLGIVSGSSLPRAREALAALALQRDDARLRARAVEAAARGADPRALARELERLFGPG
jgi:HEAT repeat protein